MQLLTPDEKSFFGHGMTRVVYHISLLFEKYGSFAYAAEFSERALAGHDSTNEQVFFKLKMREIVIDCAKYTTG